MMSKDTKSWNSFVGCKFDCVYCKDSYKKLVAWNGRVRHCSKCLEYTPHTHPERLDRLPSDRVLWIASTGDISFCAPTFARQIFQSMRQDTRKNRIFLLQSKNPEYFSQFIPDFPKNTVLMTTIESNINYPGVTKAPPVAKRFDDFLQLPWPRKALVMEPVLNFDVEVIEDWAKRLKPEAIFIGFESKRKCNLIEPSSSKVVALHKRLQGLGFKTYDKARFKYKDVF
jgi:hypothetical protein